MFSTGRAISDRNSLRVREYEMLKAGFKGEDMMKIKTADA